MRNEKRHEIAEIDASILERISEDEVAAWLVAKTNSLMSPELPVECIESEVWHRKTYREEYYDHGYKVYAAGKHGYGGTVAEAAADAREKIADNPRSRAAEKRREAQTALKEAEKLEALANSLG